MLANRSMALTTTLIDLLILGDPDVARLVPGTIRFAGNLAPDARSHKEQVATYIEVLDAVRELSQAAGDYYTSLIQYRINKAVLLRRMGILQN